jgi:hypothetical protein
MLVVMSCALVCGPAANLSRKLPSLTSLLNLSLESFLGNSQGAYAEAWEFQIQYGPIFFLETGCAKIVHARILSPCLLPFKNRGDYGANPTGVESINVDTGNPIPPTMQIFQNAFAWPCLRPRRAMMPASV